MNVILVTSWWAMVVRGMIGIALGITAFLWPAITLRVLVLLFAGYAIIDGVLAFAGATQARRARQQSGFLALEGAVGLLAGAITLARPTITTTILVYVIAAWAILTGILEIGAAIRLRQTIQGEWLMAFFGLMSVMFGIAIAVAPALGALAIALWIGAYAFASGVVLMALGFRLRNQAHPHRVETRMAA